MKMLGAALAAALLLTGAPRVIAQAPPQGGPPPGFTPPPPPKPGPVQLDIQDGSTASHRVTEQLAGVNFPNDAIGFSPSGLNYVTSTRKNGCRFDARCPLSFPANWKPGKLGKLGKLGTDGTFTNFHSSKNWGTFRLSPGFPQNAKDGHPTVLVMPARSKAWATRPNVYRLPVGTAPARS